MSGLVRFVKLCYACLQQLLSVHAQSIDISMKNDTWT